MPTREEITYIMVDDQMPSNRKIAPLSNGAFRLYVEALCWCSANHKDGIITIRAWNGMGTKKSRLELTEAELIVQSPDGSHVEVHDYLDIQRSQAEIAAVKERKSDAGKRGNHRRHHVNKGIRDPECEYCLKGVA